MKRQDSGLSSSSRREKSSEHQHAKTIGCMSGIFHLVSKSHTRRKFLTFGKKQHTSVESSSTKSKNKGDIQASPSVGKDGQNDGDNDSHFRRISHNVRIRSPTLPAEIRRSEYVNSHPNFQTPPALVARLMGLDAIPAASSAENAAEKRQKLLGALEKCDEDLKAVKKIIEALRSAERIRSTLVVKNTVDGEGKVGISSERNEFISEQPSPVSVLDEFTRSPWSYHAKRHPNGRVAMQQPVIMQQQKRKPGEDQDKMNPYIFTKISSEDQPKDHDQAADNAASSPLWGSKAMIETVNQVCRDIAWGEKREMGRIGLALQDHIYRDLIDEIVEEIGCNCHCLYSLPFEACKRRLSF